MRIRAKTVLKGSRPHDNIRFLGTKFGAEAAPRQI